ncbi:hypothetical protein LR48_Vigan11g024900 [Vigna angularis]|uniref:O-methyltransferase domain-containing protein n=1 Tax=Phaseolus angularis TaxID=3914 RepID=A0A0L9VQR8_PHAAN|nr:hypothetical protein LR48_Vigan11g024900 [Vigna angularis]
MAPPNETDNGEAKQLQHVEEEQDGLLFALNMVSSVAFPLGVNTANELGIFDIMAKAGADAKLSAEEITEKVGIKNPQAPTMVDRILRLLASHSMLSSCLGEEGQNSCKRLYSLTYASKYFVSDADGVSFGASLNLILGKVFMDSWTELKGAIAEGGIAFNRIYGMNIFEYSAVDPTFNYGLNKVMFNTTTIVTNRVLELYDGFKNINRLVDVGGVEHVAGDMFESVPSGDAIFMKWILHDWDDEEFVKLLKNCYKAIPSDGKVIVVDLMNWHYLLDSVASDSSALSLASGLWSFSSRNHLLLAVS